MKLSSKKALEMLEDAKDKTLSNGYIILYVLEIVHLKLQML